VLSPVLDREPLNERVVGPVSPRMFGGYAPSDVGAVCEPNFSMKFWRFRRRANEPQRLDRRGRSESRCGSGRAPWELVCALRRFPIRSGGRDPGLVAASNQRADNE
jgi:hypothetical protein